ncbi:hypothetical protein [Tellurirhabdus bombi]|uniref:hypothetical protein n=1 Tax=Tellurirhabdus bombi TaxID=2907205 RepID=UPI001F456AAA|nr:hypothetical protein [Tellurirhabdus bombi]
MNRLASVFLLVVLLGGCKKQEQTPDPDLTVGMEGTFNMVQVYLNRGTNQQVTYSPADSAQTASITIKKLANSKVEVKTLLQRRNGQMIINSTFEGTLSVDSGLSTRINITGADQANNGYYHQEANSLLLDLNGAGSGNSRIIAQKK